MLFLSSSLNRLREQDKLDLGRRVGHGGQEFSLGPLSWGCPLDIQVEISNSQLVIMIQRRCPDWRYKFEGHKHIDDDLSLESG